MELHILNKNALTKATLAGIVYRDPDFDLMVVYRECIHKDRAKELFF
jgi:hypothetical protein